MEFDCVEIAVEMLKEGLLGDLAFYAVDKRYRYNYKEQWIHVNNLLED